MPLPSGLPSVLGAPTDLAIANMALANLGHTVQMTDVTADQTVEAKSVRLFIDVERDACLAEFRWHWAEQRTILTQLTGTGAWWTAVALDWNYVYDLPGDMVQATALYPGRNPAPQDSIPFAQVLAADNSKDVILTDIAPVTDQSPLLLYRPRLDDPAIYPAAFIDFFAWALAARLAMPLKKDPKLASYAYQMRQAYLAKAIRFDVESRQPDQPPPTLSIRARGSLASRFF